MAKANQTKIYRDKLNQLEKQLNQENLKYFDELRSYMSFSSFFVDEAALNEQLFQMASDLYAAQGNGVSAEAFFGKDAKTMADELLKGLPKAGVKSMLEIVALITGILWGFNMLSDFSDGAVWQLSLFSYLLTPVAGIVAIWLIFKIFASQFFKERPTGKMSSMASFGLFLVIILYLALTVVSSLFFKDIWKITVPFPFDVVIIIGLAVLVTGYLLVKKESLFYPMAAMVYVFIVNGIINRLVAHYQIKGEFWQVYLPVGLFVASLVVFWIWNMRVIKKYNQQEQAGK